MFRSAAPLLLASILASILAPVAALAAQPLTIDLRAAMPRIDKLDRYDTGTALALRVMAPAASQVTIVGVGPDGSNLRVPLAAGAGGIYAGTVTLPVAGTWSFAADTTVDSEDVSTESFPVLAAEPESRLPAAIMAALALVSVAGGVGLIATARRTATAPAV
jgi:hypothetical protein